MFDGFLWLKECKWKKRSYTIFKSKIFHPFICFLAVAFPSMLKADRYSSFPAKKKKKKLKESRREEDGANKGPLGSVEYCPAAQSQCRIARGQRQRQASGSGCLLSPAFSLNPRLSEYFQLCQYFAKFSNPISTERKKEESEFPQKRGVYYCLLLCLCFAHGNNRLVKEVCMAECQEPTATAVLPPLLIFKQNNKLYVISGNRK